MVFLTANFEENEQSTGFEPLPTGEYEMVIAKAYEDATPSGAEYLQIDLVVRNDLKNAPALAETNGKYYNRYVFNPNWKRKATNQYDMKSFQYILEAIGVEEGTVISSVDDFMNLLVGKPVLVYVKKEIDDYKTTDESNPVYENTVAPWGYKKTNFPQMNHQFKDSKNEGNTSNSNNSPFEASDAIDVSDESLPF